MHPLLSLSLLFDLTEPSPTLGLDSAGAQGKIFTFPIYHFDAGWA